MKRTKKERICSFLLAAVMLATSLLSNVITVSAKEPEVPQHTISIEEMQHGCTAYSSCRRGPSAKRDFN